MIHNEAASYADAASLVLLLHLSQLQAWFKGLLPHSRDNTQLLHHTELVID